MPAYEGPRLGQRLKELEQRWIDSGFTLTRDDLLAE
jgi:poly(A) polymerase